MLDGPDGPIIEAVVSENVLKLFGVGVGDEVSVGVSQEAPARITVRIVGVADNTSLDGTLVYIASGMLNPPTIYDPEFGPPPLPLFVTETAIHEAISTTLPGMVMDAIWFIQLEPEALKAWTGAGDPTTDGRIREGTERRTVWHECLVTDPPPSSTAPRRGRSSPACR